MYRDDSIRKFAPNILQIHVSRLPHKAFDSLFIFSILLLTTVFSCEEALLKVFGFISQSVLRTLDLKALCAIDEFLVIGIPSYK